jgi:hypothetical protein
VKTLILLHAIGNGVLLWLAYQWLGIGESTTGRILLSAQLAIFLVVFATWLHATSCVFFQARDIRGAGRVALRHLPALLLLIVMTLIVYGLISAIPSPAFKIASYLTLHLRRPIKPTTLQSIFNGVMWLIRWVLLPVLIVPRFTTAASRGWTMRAHTRRIYWAIIPACLLAGLWIPLKLIGWVPRFDSFPMQMTSFLLRAAVAYALFTASWIVLARLTSRTFKE